MNTPVGVVVSMASFNYINIMPLLLSILSKEEIYSIIVTMKPFNIIKDYIEPKERTIWSSDGS
ncbi:hypothetical protein [Clostridium algoriphilum]|uniref:hypothetical protein n=1 Tax=Clostridium algoriphilum TaxID=198347 RepID=UPI003850E649